MSRSHWRSVAGGAFAAVLAAVVALAACGSKGPRVVPPVDPPPIEVGGPDGGPPGGGPPDGGPPDTFGGPGPWPIANITYGANDGIRETPLVGMSTDETQNLWVATHEALYLRRPTAQSFTRFDAAAGLHLRSNPVIYCDQYFGGGDRACPIPGGAAEAGISEIVGGGPNEVFVGYYGDEEGTQDWFDPNRHSGKLDRVRLRPDGTLQVDRFDVLLVGAGAQWWHNRSVRRMIYDHYIHRHQLYVGFNHGVDRISPDQFRYPQGEWFDTVNREWMGDHLHPPVCYHATCTSDPSNVLVGDWRALAISADGNLWVGGAYTAGKVRWHPDVFTWANRPGAQAFEYTFGDPYPLPPAQDGFINEPVFRPPQEGDKVWLSAVSVAPDGRVWFASGDGDIPYGVAVFNGRTFRTFDPQREIGMEEAHVRDLIALPNGRIVLAAANTGLVIWNPNTGESVSLHAPQWLADDRVQRLELDTMVNPPALHVSTESGATVIRLLP